MSRNKYNKILASTVLFFVMTMPSFSLRADNPVTTITITGTVINKTCSFNDVSQTVTLDDIYITDFSDTSIKGGKNVSVGISCGDGVSSVKIVPTGTADTNDNTAFSNTGTASNVALRFQDSAGTTLFPDGSSSVTVTPSEGEAVYTFKAGYVATGGKVTAGSFISQVNMSFDYE